MADYKEKLDDWQRAARRKAREIDEKLDLKGMVEDGARAAGDVARRGAETVANGAERLRTEVERLDQDSKVGETARRAGGAASRRAKKAAGKAAKEAGEVLRDATGEAGDKAREVFKDAKKHYQRAAKVYDTGARMTRASTAATSAAFKAKDWVKENPGKAAAVSFSLILGVRLGASFPGIDAVLLGSHPHWLTHSALPVWGLKKASEKFDGYLRKQEALIAAGELSEAERERVQFQRKMAKYVGAPLLGAFSCAAGAVMFAQIGQPGRIAGSPISWLLGGNPFLDGVWLFANGVICFHQGYKFFMIALADQEDVARVVREIKGLLPAASGV
ncbi:MAG TPA: hypothetical protein VGJ55_17120 [Pyrinomonadaceae bacterium]|jgi:ElaB/YqjD/DUF883 family membrane-anchored ribosome-binding protein